MFIYMPQKQLASVHGECEKSARCEICAKEYKYILARSAVGEDRSLFSWTQKSAFAKAVVDGQKKLADLLEKEIGVAPCPDCGWVQAAMVDAMNARSYAGMKTFSTLALLVGFGTGGVLLFVAFLSQPFVTFTFVLALSLMAIGALSSVGLSFLRSALLRRGDPNRDFIPTTAEATWN